MYVIEVLTSYYTISPQDDDFFQRLVPSPYYLSRLASTLTPLMLNSLMN